MSKKYQSYPKLRKIYPNINRIERKICNVTALLTMHLITIFNSVFHSRISKVFLELKVEFTWHDPHRHALWRVRSFYFPREKENLAISFFLWKYYNFNLKFDGLDQMRFAGPSPASVWVAIFSVVIVTTVLYVIYYKYQKTLFRSIYGVINKLEIFSHGKSLEKPYWQRQDLNQCRWYQPTSLLSTRPVDSKWDFSNYISWLSIANILKTYIIWYLYNFTIYVEAS